MKSLFFAMTMALSLIIFSCDNNSVQPTIPSNPRYGDIPKTAQWAEAFYNLTDNSMQEYSTGQPFCQNLTVNKKLITLGVADSTAILLNGQLVYSWVGITHIFVGQASDKCILFAEGLDAGIGYLNNSMLNIDGKNIPEPKPVNGYGVHFLWVKEYINGWVIIQAETGHVRAENRQNYWLIYNVQTGELRDLGAYGPYYKK